MSTEKIVKLLRGLATLCLVAGVIIAGVGIIMIATMNDSGIVLIVSGIMSGALGYVTYSAMANMMEAIDSIAKTNERIANTLEKTSSSPVGNSKGYDNSLPPM